MSDLIGKRIGTYHLKRRIASGASADVYLGVHAVLGRENAIKISRTRLSAQEGATFLEEARLISSKLSHPTHPNIVDIVDAGLEEDPAAQKVIPYIVMEYASRGSILNLHRQGSILPAETIISYVKQIAEALEYAHTHGVVHRDVKPANILVADDGRLLLSDFGIAVTMQTASQQGLPAIGTVGYIAPEQLNGHPEPASDQYSLAIIVYEWFCEKRPFEGSIEQICEQHLHTPPPPLSWKVNIRSRAEEAVMKALAKDPTQRFASVVDFARALELAYQEDPFVRALEIAHQEDSQRRLILSNPPSSSPPRVAWANVTTPSSSTEVIPDLVISGKAKDSAWSKFKSQFQCDFEILFASTHLFFHWLGLIIIILSASVLSGPLNWGDMWLWTSVTAGIVFFIYVAALRMLLIFPMALLLAIYWGYTGSIFISWFIPHIYNVNVAWYVTAALCCSCLVLYRSKTKYDYEKFRKNKESVIISILGEENMQNSSIGDASSPGSSSPNDRPSLIEPSGGTATKVVESAVSLAIPLLSPVTGSNSLDLDSTVVKKASQPASPKRVSEAPDPQVSSERVSEAPDPQVSSERVSEASDPIADPEASSEAADQIADPDTPEHVADSPEATPSSAASGFGPGVHYPSTSAPAEAGDRDKKSFYISFIKSDESHARFVGSLLGEDAHFPPEDFRGLNFKKHFRDAFDRAIRIIIILSPAYLNALHEKDPEFVRPFMHNIKKSSFLLICVQICGNEFDRLLANAAKLINIAGDDPSIAHAKITAALNNQGVTIDSESFSSGKTTLGASDKVSPSVSFLNRSTSRRIEIFVSYSHKDKALKEELSEHFGVLKREKVIMWQDGEISAGRDWRREINDHLENAAIILLLVTKSFLNSEFCYSIEMTRAIERHNRNEARVIPIILSPSDWKETDMVKLQALPRGAEPISDWGDRDSAFFHVVDEVRKVIKQIADEVSDQDLR